MPGPRAGTTFLYLFAVSAAAGVLAGSVGQVALDNVACRSSGYGSGFLAYCQSRLYGSYEAKALGERFLAEVGVERRCVVLTGTPNSRLDSSGIAESLAVALATRSIIPPTEGLATLEGEHLNPASAERWSAHFVELLTPILAECSRHG